MERDFIGKKVMQQPFGVDKFASDDDKVRERF